MIAIVQLPNFISEREFNAYTVLIFFSSNSRLFFANRFIFGSSSRALRNSGFIFTSNLATFLPEIARRLFAEANGRDDFAATLHRDYNGCCMNGSVAKSPLPPALQHPPRIFLLAQRCRGSLGNCTCVLFATGTHISTPSNSTQVSPEILRALFRSLISL